MSNSRAAWAEKALRRMGRQARGAGGLLDALADTTHDAVFVVDAERNLVAFNDRAELLTGLQRDDVLGRSCLAGFKCGTCLDSCGIFERGDFRDVPVEIHQSAGRRLAVLKSAVVVRDCAGEVIGAVETFRPVGDEVSAREGVEATWAGMQSMMDSLGRGVPLSYSWPGNATSALPQASRPAAAAGAQPDVAALLEPWPDRRSILAALDKSHHRRGAAAKLLGISRSTLWRRMKDFGFE